MKILLSFLVLLMGCTNVLREKIEADKKSIQTDEVFALARARVDPAAPNVQILIHYEALREALASDRLQDVAPLITKFREVLKDTHPDTLATLLSLTEPVDEDELRTRFGDLSKSIISLYRASKDQSFQAYRCPMAKRYSDWIQPKNLEIANPYMGKRMLACGFPVEMESTK